MGYDVPVVLAARIASPAAMSEDGYTAKRAGDAVRVTYRMRPIMNGMWDVGADFTWGCAHQLVETAPMQAAQEQAAGDQSWDVERTAAFSAFTRAREMFAQRRYADALRLIESEEEGAPLGAAAKSSSTPSVG